MSLYSLVGTPQSANLRVLPKLSGGFFAGEGGNGFGFEGIKERAKWVIDAAEGRELALVIGGGNLLRGFEASSFGVDRPTADGAGMLATVMNALVFQSLLESLGRDTRVMTAIDMQQIAEPFIRRRAIRHLEKGRIVILAGGTGNPYFTTDSAAALRAAELNCSSLIKATSVKGVYTADPKKNPEARLLERVSPQDFLMNDYRVMDASAVSLCRENGIPILVFKLDGPDTLKRAMAGENVGTVIA